MPRYHNQTIEISDLSFREGKAIFSTKEGDFALTIEEDAEEWGFLSKKKRAYLYRFYLEKLK